VKAYLSLRPLRLCGSVFIYKPPASLKQSGTPKFFHLRRTNQYDFSAIIKKLNSYK